MESNWLLLLSAATVGSLFSLIGGIFLLKKKFNITKVQRAAIPFAAGALLGASYFDLIPHAFESGEDARFIALVILGGFLMFFALERFLGWFHHYHQQYGKVAERRRSSTRVMIVIGDTVHNLIDGFVIGGAFLVDPIVGIVTTVAVAAHEIPQEIGDFGALLALGMSKTKVLLVNIASAIVTVVAASFVYAFGGGIEGLEPVLLAFTAGLFIYIAASDLIPTIHAETKFKHANMQAIILLLGIAIVGATTALAHDFLRAQFDDGHGHGHTHAEVDTHDHEEHNHEDEHDHDREVSDHHAH